MTRAALYARYSTDKQTHQSVDGQFRLCRAHAAHLGIEVVAEYSDDAVSGAVPLMQRAGGRRLMADALAGKFEVLLIEGLDRLSRDLVDGERMVRRLEHGKRVRIIGVSDGYDSHTKGGGLLRKVRGALNEEYRADVAAKVHRGLVNQLASGYHAGGLSYGYRSVVVGVDARGEPIGHRLEVNEEQAPWVRLIFERYVDGAGPFKIADELNRARIAAPRGGLWAVSAIYGRSDRGAGILNNELYIGQYVWNRSQWLKDPDTGKRIRVDRPASEWHRREMPELRIVSDDLWQAARDRQRRGRHEGGSAGRGGITRTLFGGMLVCGKCGGPMIAVSKWAYGCGARKAKGETACTGTNAPRKDVDARLLSLVREEVTGPEAIRALREEYRKLEAEARNERPSEEGVRLAELEREVGRLVESITRMGGSRALEQRLQEAESERAVLRGQALAMRREVPTLAAYEAAYKALVLRLRDALGGDTTVARPLLRELLGEIRLVAEGDAIFAEVGSRPARLLAAGGSSLGLVAGIRFGTRKRIQISGPDYRTRRTMR